MCKSLVNSWKLIHYINRQKKKSHMIISVGRKSIWQNPIPGHNKNFQQTENIGRFPQSDKEIYKKNLLLPSHLVVRAGHIHPTIKNKTRMSSLTTLIQQCTGSPRECKRQEKERKGIQTETEETKLFLFTDDLIICV